MGLAAASYAFTPDAQSCAAGLKRRHLLELRRLRCQPLEQRKENMPQRSCGPPCTQQLSPSPMR
jgi:hypothetical protein